MKHYKKLKKSPLLSSKGFSGDGVYVVLNFGSWRGAFWSLDQAKQCVEEEGTDKKTGKAYYQIYKCNIELTNVRERIVR